MNRMVQNGLPGERVQKLRIPCGVQQIFKRRGATALPNWDEKSFAKFVIDSMKKSHL